MKAFLGLKLIAVAAVTLALAGLANRRLSARRGAIDERPWADPNLSPDERATLLVSAMTQDEKFAWLSGPMAIPINGNAKPEGALGSAAYYPAIVRLGIPAMQQTDASLGVGNLGDIRPGDHATALPSSLLLGASFCTKMATETGAMVGQEARAKGFNVQLAGGANLIREPRCGRNFEYISEDPLLTGLIAGHSVAGIQSQRIVSTVKHFVLNNQETGRIMVSADLSEAAMRESDLLAFQIAIEVGEPGSVMPGYNLVNGEYASENAFLLNTVLKGDWQYPGWVMSDWGATHSTERASMSGLDVQSGANLDLEPFFGEPLRQAVVAGRVPQSRIDDAVRRQLRSLFAVGAIDDPPVAGREIDFAAHRLIAQRAAEAGIVLLKNEGGLLPIAPTTNRILVIGGHADVGVLSGGGSSLVTPNGSVRSGGLDLMGLTFERVYHPSPPLSAIVAEADTAKVEFLDGFDLVAACDAARDADIVIVFAEEWRAEGMDTPDLSLAQDQDDLIAAVAANNKATVVVLETGGPVTMPWLGDVRAVLAAFYPGAGGGEAIAALLFGRVNPSGHLPITFPASTTQLPHPQLRDPTTTTSNPGLQRKGEIFHVNHNIEGSDVGYRWYERQGIAPLFPFGHGLSYTEFALRDLTVSDDQGDICVMFTIQNMGNRAGADIAQIYVSYDGPAGFVSRLAGFARIMLVPGELKHLRVAIDRRLLARFDAASGQWRIAGGDYRFMLAHDAATIAAEVHVEVSTDVIAA